MYIEYYSILLFFFIAFILSLVLLLGSVTIVYQNMHVEKVSSYECGFNPFQDARGKFDVQFYLVAILFIIFDLEISFLFPWVLILNLYFVKSIMIMLIFLILLTVGFLYEWKKGALEW